MSELTSTTGFLDEQFPVFAQHYRTIRYDLRGFGQTRLEAGTFANHEDAAALLDALGAQQAHVIGVSHGSEIALDFTLAHPELVASLVMVAPSVGGAQLSERIRSFIREENALVEQSDLQGATELNLRLWVNGLHRAPEQVHQAVRQRLYEMQYHAFTIPIPEGIDEEELQPPAITRLSEVRVPTLVIVGDLDLPEKLELSEHLTTGIPGARQEIIAGAAHMVSMEQPQEFNRIVLDFLSEV